MNIAVIDIGSNSIRYMEAGQADGKFIFSRKSVYTTRLAEGLSATKKLSTESMERSLQVLSDLACLASAHSLPCFCYATSAVRDAENRDVFLSSVRNRCGLSIEVLSGEDEARLAYLGCGTESGGMVDIGGGSSQVITESYRSSFPVGCVRIRDWCPSQTLSDLDGLLSLFDKTYAFPEFSCSRWTAVGGTATTLGALSLGLDRYDPAVVSGASLTSETLTALLIRLDAIGDEERSRIPLLKDRHNVIVGGGFLLRYLMRRLGTESVTVSDADGLEGYARKILQSTP